MYNRLLFDYRLSFVVIFLHIRLENVCILMPLKKGHKDLNIMLMFAYFVAAQNLMIGERFQDYS